MRYAYPCSVVRDEEEERATGREAWVVTFPDVPGANSGGWSKDEALELAVDCLTVALGMHVKAREGIPAPSPPAEGQALIAVSPVVAAKLALHTAMREQGLANVALARRLGVGENTVRRLLDLRHRSHIASVNEALRALGRHIVVEDETTRMPEPSAAPASG